MQVLLVEPDYYTRYPPLGLLKLASHHRSYGNEVELVRGVNRSEEIEPDQIEVTSLFTYAWKPVHKVIDHYRKEYPDAKIRVGGIYATLLPDHITDQFPFVDIHPGLFMQAERYLPSYDLLQNVDRWKDWSSSILFASRGCIRKCPFCAVPKLEGGIRPAVDEVQEFIYRGHKNVIFWDNNIFASPNWSDIFEQLDDLKLKVDFNQGLDARLIDEEKAEKLSRLRIDSIRLAYDHIKDKETITRAVNLLQDHGIRKRKIFFYVLYNYYNQGNGVGDTPEDFLQRIKDIASIGCVAYPMRFEPLDSLKKNDFISPLWNQSNLELVARARRVIGFGGAFPPYTGLVDKFNDAKNFQEAFELRPVEVNDSKESQQVSSKGVASVQES